MSRLSRSLKVTGIDTDRLTTYDFLSVIHSNHGLSHTISDITQFPSQIANFSHPRVFNAATEGVPLGIL